RRNCVFVRIQYRPATVGLEVSPSSVVTGGLPDITVVDSSALGESGGVALDGRLGCSRFVKPCRRQVVGREGLAVVVGVNQGSLADLADIARVNRAASGLTDPANGRDKNR